MKYLGSVLGRIAVAVIFFGIMMAGIVGQFPPIGNIFAIITGLGGIGVSIWAIVSKHDKKEIDAEEKQQQEYVEKRLETKAAEIKEQEAFISQGDYKSAPLGGEKAILFELAPLILRGGASLEVRLNDISVGTVDSKNRKLRFAATMTNNYLYFVNQQTQQKSKYCFFSVSAIDGEGYIGYLGSTPDGVFQIKRKCGIVSEFPEGCPKTAYL